MANLTARIRLHYNLLAPFYYALWGQHLHHGYWVDGADATPQAQAQERLIEEIYDFAGSPRQPRVFDVGCGYAGSLLWLARHAAATGSGITLSRMQRAIGQLKLRRNGLQGCIAVRVADAQREWPVRDASVSLVWCVECSEHLSDRAHFMRQAYRALAPNGTLCLAAWVASESATPDAQALRAEVERGMLCYPFSTVAEYAMWCGEAGFTDIETRTITAHVAHTWDICIALRDRPPLPLLARLLGSDVRTFTDSFTALRRAYRDGAMDYALLVARKPA